KGAADVLASNEKRKDQPESNVDLESKTAGSRIAERGPEGSDRENPCQRCDRGRLLCRGTGTSQRRPEPAPEPVRRPQLQLPTDCSGRRTSSETGDRSGNPTVSPVESRPLAPTAYERWCAPAAVRWRARKAWTLTLLPQVPIPHQWRFFPRDESR